MADFLVNATKIPQPLHPFYPLEANIIGYLANRWSVPTLLGIFFAGCAVILGTTLGLVKGQNRSLPRQEQATVLWFVLCMSLCGYNLSRGPWANHRAAGTIHLFFEGTVYRVVATSEARWLSQEQDTSR